MARDTIKIGEVDINADDDNKGLADRLRKFREKVQRKEKATRAKRRARARRIDREEPEGLGEKFAVTKNRLAEAGEEASGLVDDTREYASTALGADADRDGESLLSQASGAFDELDADGVAEPMFENEESMVDVDAVEATEAVEMDDPDDMDSPLDDAEAVEDDLF